MQILLVEDDPSHAQVIRHALQKHGHAVTLATTAAQGKAELATRRYDVMLVDYVLPDATGLTLLEWDARRIPAIFLTATDSAQVCLTAIRAGAADYIVKDTDYLRTLPERVSSALETPASISSPRAKPAHTSHDHTALDRMLGASSEMLQLKRLTQRAARTDLPVLIEGPTGAGKELVAHAIHELGPRAHKPFIVINCAALPPALFESEVFGHVKGAFTNAVADRRGLVLGAHEGTLFLDEIAELALENQAKLLRLLQNLEFRPVGSDHQRHANVRVIAATNHFLPARVGRRLFREDLYFRLAVVRINVPALASRGGDIRCLARAMVDSVAPRLGLRAATISEGAYQQLEHHTWPGNVRELENVIKRTLAALEGTTITSFDIADADRAAHAHDRARIQDLLAKFGGNLTQVARELGVSRPTLYKRLNLFGLRPDTFRSG